jgi:hypothetical protein
VRNNEGLSCSAELHQARIAAEDAYEKTCKALYSTQQQARAEFLKGRPNGWKFAPARGDGETLYTEKLYKQLARAGLPTVSTGPALDHPEVVLCEKCPVAVVSHSYATQKQIEQYVAANHLNAEFLWWSWYYPGGCTAVLFTKGDAA